MVWSISITCVCNILGVMFATLVYMCCLYCRKRVEIITQRIEQSVLISILFHLLVLNAAWFRYGSQDKQQWIHLLPRRRWMDMDPTTTMDASFATTTMDASLTTTTMDTSYRKTSKLPKRRRMLKKKKIFF